MNDEMQTIERDMIVSVEEAFDGKAGKFILSINGRPIGAYREIVIFDDKGDRQVAYLVLHDHRAFTSKYEARNLIWQKFTDLFRSGSALKDLSYLCREPKQEEQS